MAGSAAETYTDSTIKRERHYMPNVDLFLQQYLSRHSQPLPAQVAFPRGLAWALALALAASTGVTIWLGQPLACVPFWALVAGLAGMGLIRASTLLQSATMSAAALLLLWGASASTQPLPLILLCWAAGGLAGLAFGFAVSSVQKARLNTAKNDLLQQVYQLWARSDGSCLKEISLDGALLSMSEKGMQVMEVCDFSKLAGSDWLSFWAGEWAEPARSAFNQAKTGQLARFSGFCPTAQGTPKWWDVVLMPVMGTSGVRSVLSLSWDITDSKNASLALQASNEELTLLLQGLSDGFYKLDQNWTFLRVNPTAEALLGQSEAELQGRSVWSHFPVAPDCEFHASLTEVMELRIPRRFQVLIAPLQRWYRVHAYPCPDGISVFFNDVSQEVETLHKHQAAEARLRLSQEIGLFADWQFDLTDQKLLLSDQALQLIGLAAATIDQHQDALARLIHPADRLDFLSALLDVAEGDSALSTTVRLRADKPEDGSIVQWRHFRFAGAVIKPLAQPRGVLIGSVQDITEQKVREQQLVEAEQFSRSIIDAMPLYLGVVDARGVLQATNEAWRSFIDHDAPFWAEEGDDYFAVCKSAADKGFDVGNDVADGIRRLLDGTGDPFQFHSEPQQNGGKIFRTSAVSMGCDGKRVLIMHEDLTEQMANQQIIKRQAERLQLAHEGSNDGLWEWRPQEQHTYVSERFVALLGEAPEEGCDFSSWLRARIHPQDLPGLVDLVDKHVQDEKPFDIEMRLTTKAGWRWFRSRGKAELENNRIIRFAGSLSDISVQRDLLAQVQASEARFRDIVEQLPHVFWEFDVASAKLTYVSPAFETLFGMNPRMVYANPSAWLDLVAKEDRHLAERFLSRALHELQPAEAEFRGITPDGQEIWIRDRAFPFTDSTGKICRVVGMAENISEARFYQQRLYAASHFDSVNELPNRLLFTERLELQCKQPGEQHHAFLVMLIAVERLRWVDQSLGQLAKDELIRQVSDRFRTVLGERGYLASFGGGEFAVLLSRKEELSEVDPVARDIIAALEAPLVWDSESVSLSARIGAAQFPADGDTADLLLKHASVALYTLQTSGRSGFASFNQDMLQSSLDSLKLETELTRAIEHEEFVLFYQPKYDLGKQMVCGAEALIRWQHPEHGLVGPFRFIHLLESTDLIVPVGRWCINQALAQLAQWRTQGVQQFVMAVNVSLKQLQPSLVEHVRQALETYDVEPQYLELELTESIMHEPGDATRIVDELRDLGVRIAVDDFGTGYSTLGSLKSFVPDTLKIDKQFLNEVEHDKADQAIVRGVIELAHALNMTVVAEGVECAHQKTMLEQLDCDQIQGYLLSPPIEALAFAEQFLQRQGVAEQLAAS